MLSYATVDVYLVTGLGEEVNGAFLVHKVQFSTVFL